MLKRAALVASALALTTGMGSVAFAAEASLDASGQSKSIDVVAKYVDDSTTPNVYSVDISWESMTFVYKEAGVKTWDPGTHTFVNNITAGWVDDTSVVTVINHSNVDVDVSLAYVPSGDNGVEGALDPTSKTLTAGAINKPESAAFLKSTLTISGTPSSTVTPGGIKVGSINVQVA